MYRILALALITTPLLSSAAQAQDFEDLDGGGGGDEGRSRGRDIEDREVKEIVRGFYAKANVGGALYLLDFAGYVNPGTAVGLALGQDFIDNSGSSMAWELGFYQGIHNGAHYEVQDIDGCIIAGGNAPCVQGDLRTYTLLASIEWSAYLNRRLGIGLRAGGGMLTSPLLMDQTAYEEDVVQGTWGLSLESDPGYHGTIHPLVGGGPTFEYYSKLSHFSIGADVDFFYAVNFDLGSNISGYLKYTF
jgi:hypothetical protein